MPRQPPLFQKAAVAPNRRESGQRLAPIIPAVRGQKWGAACLAVIAIFVGGGASLAEEPANEVASGTASYLKALALQRKGKWSVAKKAFRKFLKAHPDSEHAADAKNRSGDNAFLGCSEIWEGGPSERRIDVAVMGDGFTVASGDQKLQEKWSKLCIDVLFHEAAFGEYRNYFNVHFVRLASLDEGVDPKLTPEQRQKLDRKNRYRSRKKKSDYSTALDCKAMGPQGQVMADRGLVLKWLDIAAREKPGIADDRFVIAFARFGKLGMGGGGIANVGRPDKSVTVHEFGHAFSRLLDEYQGNPNPPTPPARAMIRAPNASTTPDPKKVPWAHMIKKRVKGVGVHEGGATYTKGVWRPARTCAMNAAGATSFCPVCREATVLVIYEHVSPVDIVAPPTELEVSVAVGDDTRLFVTPMAPLRHKLEVTWHVLAADPEEQSVLVSGSRSVDSGAQRRGYRSKLGIVQKGSRKKPRRHGFPVGKLAPGLYRVIARVRDTTPWVVSDPSYLLEERVSWLVRVRPKP